MVLLSELAPRSEEGGFVYTIYQSPMWQILWDCLGSISHQIDVCTLNASGKPNRSDHDQFVLGTDNSCNYESA